MDDRSDPARRREQDPTLVRNQPALRSARRGWWFLWSGLFALVSIGVLAWLAVRQTAVAVIGIAIIAALYAAVLIVGATVSAPPRRNAAFAWLTIAMAVVALGSTIAIMMIEWS
ncbi:hypothetical protein [Microbacterium sp.]|uniref:hypothetical protein n=1 Tax=Microbacterium sp. TaxID=51671 RepID=UPI0037C5E25C